MCNHGKAVMRSSKNACVIIDMPFATYQQSKEQAFSNAAKIIKRTGCSGVKIEGGKIMADTINFLTERSIPVLGHIGLLPQSVNIYGGYRKFGKEDSERKKLLDDAKQLESAGAFAIVMENIISDLAKEISSSIKIPTIGIGSGKYCDGQIMVTEDIVGMSENIPAFAKQFFNFNDHLAEAVKSYIKNMVE